jgi:hypothetical protein
LSFHSREPSLRNLGALIRPHVLNGTLLYVLYTDHECRGTVTAI